MAWAAYRSACSASARMLALPASTASALARTWFRPSRSAAVTAARAWLSQVPRSHRQVKAAASWSSRIAAVLTAPIFSAASRASSSRSTPAWSNKSIVPSSCRARSRHKGRSAVSAVTSARSNAERAADR